MLLGFCFLNYIWGKCCTKKATACVSVVVWRSKNATAYPHFTRVQLQLVHLELVDVSLTIETFLILLKVSNKGPTLSPKTNTIKHLIFPFPNITSGRVFPTKEFLTSADLLRIWNHVCISSEVVSLSPGTAAICVCTSWFSLTKKPWLLAPF